MSNTILIRDECPRCKAVVFVHFAHCCAKGLVKFPSLTEPVTYGLDFAWTPLYDLAGLEWAQFPHSLRGEIEEQICVATSRETARKTIRELNDSTWRAMNATVGTNNKLPPPSVLDFTNLPKVSMCEKDDSKEEIAESIRTRLSAIVQLVQEIRILWKEL